MVLASLPLAKSWHSLRNLVSRQWRFCHKSCISTQWYQEEKLSVSVLLLLLQRHYSYNLTKNKSLLLLRLVPNNYTSPHCYQLLTSWSINDFGFLIRVCLSTLSQTLCLVMTSYISAPPCLYLYSFCHSIAMRPSPPLYCCLSVLPWTHFSL